MIAILNECGLILERRRLRAEKVAIEMETQQERLRSNLLRAISHDLRTPLTSISGNAGVLDGKEHCARRREKAGVVPRDLRRFDVAGQPDRKSVVHHPHRKRNHGS